MVFRVLLEIGAKLCFGIKRGVFADRDHFLSRDFDPAVFGAEHHRGIGGLDQDAAVNHVILGSDLHHLVLQVK